MYTPSLNEFLNLFAPGIRIPVMLEVPLENENPVSVIENLKLAGQPLVLLESGKGTENLARYTFLGFQPCVTFRSRGYRSEITADNGTEIIEGDPYEALQGVLARYPVRKYPGLPKFYGGAMGYFSYDFGRYFEELPELTEDDLALPESCFLFMDRVICLDHFEKNIKIIVNIKCTADQNPEETYRAAAAETEAMARALKAEPPAAAPEIRDRRLQHSLQPVCNMTKEQFEGMVVKAKEYIRAGDIFQANLSIRVGNRISAHPFELYKVLREVNPSPYMSFIDFGDLHIVSSSPELLVRVQGDLAETRPIAGTRRRGLDREEDLALARELVSNEKERAEHIMLVDLERNDLGRVCRYGTVEVNELMVIEEYSHVMHIVSNVRGRLAPGRDRFDLFRACFPGGTITGAPKIRSMEIIEELEPTRRGPYTGSIGFFGYDDEMEMNIVIRTLVIKDGMAYVQAGAGIVADSVPEREYFESMKKAEALLRAIEIAETLAAENRASAGEKEAAASA
jgi:anthranilate synthase component 1/para-aminobenzoate synthetase component 1